MVLASDGTAVLVDLGDRNLDGAVVLGLNDAVGGAALARDVAGRFLCQQFWQLKSHCRIILQVDDLAAVVLHGD